ncbi:organic solute transporter alpha-like protein [Culicoides brevitarsis]|uniref:organic solute transporter alpha-like protein n=1 Tax=Culicoides brevitarsis TaxID=469753 RepID=UPI00307B1815
MTLSISLVPRAFFFCDTISHITFVICAYQMFNLFLRYVDGESKLIEFHQEKPKKFNVATPPCCCLLRLCFKKLPITKGRIDLTRILILQLTISHILLYIVLNIILINDVTTFNSIILYATPFIVGPILLGVWGLNIMLRMFDEAAPDYKLKGKYFALQLVLIFCKLLPAVEKVLSSLWLQNRICNEVTAPPTYLLLIISVLLLILQIWASRLYRYPIRI